jgi:photosystem II stability/assembly factor-like uncharacterized protein
MNTGKTHSRGRNRRSASAVRIGLLLTAGLLLNTGWAAPGEAIPAEIAAKAEHSPMTKIVRAGDQLIAVGARGHILRSADGLAWQQVPVPVNVLLTSVYFVDAKLGWAVGHDASILHSRDGGKTWALQNYQPDQNLALLDLLFLDAQRGYAIGAYGLILETRDGGASWTKNESEIASAGLHLNAISRLGDGSLLLVGEEGMLAQSRDEGASWQRLPSPYESSLFAVLPQGQSGALIAGLRGNAFRSQDLATGQWVRLDSRSAQSVFGLSSLGDGRAALVGANASIQLFDPATGLRPLPLRSPQPLAKDGPQAPPLTPAGTLPNAQELGAFSSAIAYRQGLVSAGEAGLHYWRLD